MSLRDKRLVEERRGWRKDHPVGFYARPTKNADGSADMGTWQCGIPGKEGTDWEGAVFPITLIFPADYPTVPPECRFPANFFHPNVYPSGKVCLSILDAEKTWLPSISVRAILVGVQTLLDTPNANDSAQANAHELFHRNKKKYKEEIIAQTAKYKV